MAYDSVDQLQNVLAEEVFHYAKDAKKAAGRALGTLVEIITFYLLKSSDFEYSIAIESSLPEYGNPDIAHNVEYSLNPILREYKAVLDAPKLPITSARILAGLDVEEFPIADFSKTSRVLLTAKGILRNACVIARSSRSQLVATVDTVGGHTPGGDLQLAILEQYAKPYAMFECKRVGVEEGTKKGPQTIEKAKQGAYVARAVSSLQKTRLPSGELTGLIYKADGTTHTRPYVDLVDEVIGSHDPELLRDFVLTVGVVSNHGNWFTSDAHNKELKVLAQSYDWLLFLTDDGLSEFIIELLLEPTPILQPTRDAFLASYTAEKTKNQFTKVQMNYQADQVLQTYFRDNMARIGDWFNIISPVNGTMPILFAQVSALRDKDWRKVHGL